MKVLNPFVYWAQTESQVTFKVDLKNVKVNIGSVVFGYFCSYKVFSVFPGSNFGFDGREH